MIRVAGLAMSLVYGVVFCLNFFVGGVIGSGGRIEICGFIYFSSFCGFVVSLTEVGWGGEGS